MTFCGCSKVNASIYWEDSLDRLEAVVIGRGLCCWLELPADHENPADPVLTGYMHVTAYSMQLETLPRNLDDATHVCYFTPCAPHLSSSFRRLHIAEASVARGLASHKSIYDVKRLTALL